MPVIAQGGLVAPTAAASPAKLNAGAARGAIEAFDWARWEHMLSVQKRTLQWQTAAGIPIKGSRRMIYDTRDRAWYRSDFVRYSGSRTYRWSSRQGGKSQAVTMQELLQVQQRWININIQAWHERLGRSLLGHEYVELKYVERARRWQLPNQWIVSGPSLSDILSHERDTSRSEGNKSKHGWLSRMPRKFTA